MKTTINRIPKMTLEEFADKHGLNLVVEERRNPMPGVPRYCAFFSPDCEEMDRGLLRSAFGNGSTPKEAVASYARRLSLTRIVIGAYTKRRREIDVPRLTSVGAQTALAPAAADPPP